MKVKELIALLSEFDPELEVIYQMYSDYSYFEPGDIKIEKLIPKGHYLERYYPHQYKDSEQPELKSYIVFPGN